MVDSGDRSPSSEVLWSVTDYQGNFVECTEDTMIHIRDGRGEDIPGLTTAMQGNIVEPELVVASEKFSDTRIYSRWNVLGGRYTNQWLHVAVSFQGAFGQVRSAYPGKVTKPGTPIFVRLKK